MKIPVYDLTGTKIKDITLDKEVFEAPINADLMAQAVRIYTANQRVAAAKALTRAEVDRTRMKIYRQKGTGGARHGDRRSPIMVGGGKAHGPTGIQNFELRLPEKMKAAALKSALSVKAKEGGIIAVDGLTGVEIPKTKTMAELFAKIFDPKDLRSIAVVVAPKMDQAIKSTRNFVFAQPYRAQDLTTYEVLKSRKLLVTVEALEQLQKRLSTKQ